MGSLGRLVFFFVLVTWVGFGAAARSAERLPTERLPEALRLEIEASGKVDRELVSELGRAERVRAIVVLDVRTDSGRRLSSFRARAAREELARTADRLAARLPAEVRVERRHRAFNSMVVETDAEGVQALAADPAVAAVGLSERLEWSLAEAIPTAGVTQARKGAKHGKGRRVVVMDSGVDTDHTDLKKALKGQECFCSPDCCPNGSARQSGRGSAEDDVGHGTAVSGVIVSRGKQAARGVAMKAKLHMVKVGSVAGPDTADVLAAIDWLLEEGPEADALNMSFGSVKLWGGNCDRKGATNRAYTAAFKALREAGIVPVAAAGNSGTAGKMSSPACVKDALSVGAVYDEDLGPIGFSDCQDPTTGPNQVVCFSCRSAKMDLVAPGAMITTARAGGGTVTVPGTSFSSPMVAGCALLLRKENPDASVDDIEAALEASSVQVVDPVNGRRYPALHCQEALDFLAQD